MGSKSYAYWYNFILLLALNINIQNTKINQLKNNHLRYSLLILFLISAAKAFGQNQVNPDGPLVLVIFIFLVIIIIMAAIFPMLKNIRKKGYVLKISINREFGGYKDKNDKPFAAVLVVKILNKGNESVEIDPPVLEFEWGDRKRKFRIKQQDQDKLYPLYMFPNTSHQVKIRLGKFYENDSALIKYPWVRISVYSSTGLLLKQKKKRISNR